MKWAVIGHGIFQSRYQVLNQYLCDRGVAAELEIVECPPLEFAKVAVEIQKRVNQVRIESPFRGTVLELVSSRGIMALNLGAADCLRSDGTRWWPDASLYYAFNELFSHHGERLDIGAGVLVVGAGAGARLAIAASVRAGFSKVYITSKFDDQGIRLVSELKRTLFGVHIEFVTQDRLVLLPGTNSLVINTTPLVPSNDLLAELYYLNFLRPDGMIWDLVISPGTTPLIREGEQVDISCVRGREVAAISDSIWLQWVLPHLSAARDELLEQYVVAFPDVDPAPLGPDKSRTLA